MAIEKLFSQKLAKKSAASATQKFLDVAEVRENVIILKNGALRAVLAVSSINYDLKSSDEQEAIIGQYQNFLNSLDFPIQILIASRKINMEKYMDFIEIKEREQSNELLKLQISEYKNFINQLVTVSNIMDKDFYIIVPFSPIENVEKGFFKKMFSAFGKHDDFIEKQESFQTYKNQLFQRLDHITTGLSGIGLRLAHLETQELIELLYNSYNPAIYTPNAMVNIGDLDIKQ
jgi:hypothetical protein